MDSGVIIDGPGPSWSFDSLPTDLNNDYDMLLDPVNLGGTISEPLLQMPFAPSVSLGGINEVHPPNESPHSSETAVEKLELQDEIMHDVDQEDLNPGDGTENIPWWRVKDLDEEDEPSHTYDLRPGPRLDANMPGCAYDQDDTGDFDPDAKPKCRPRKKKIRVVEALEDSMDEEEEQDFDMEEPEDDQFVIMLKFTNTTVLAQFHDPDEITYEDTSDTYNFRPRAITEALEQVGEVLAQADPRARGCRACLKLGEPCSLLENEFHWPCDACEDAGVECQLLTEPAKKLECTNCKRPSTRKAGIICSYLWESDNTGPCRHCTNDGVQCYAGPDPASIRERVRLDNNGDLCPSQRPSIGKTRWAKSCKACQDSVRQCSFARDADATLCIACDMNGVTCEPIEIGRRPAARQSKPRATGLPAIEDSDEEPAPASSMQSTIDRLADVRVAPPRIATQPASRISHDPPVIPRYDKGEKFISTKFCHPIAFQYDTPGNGCHFCKHRQFGIVGLEAVKVLVRQSSPGQYQELKGGHAAAGVESTKMCSYCTLERVKIINCDKHAIRELEASRPINLYTAMTSLKGSEDRNKWCSICCNLAMHKCCASQQDSSNGCGLLLCRFCALMLQAMPYNGRLDRMLRGLKDEPSRARPFGLRADYEFLMRDGMLFKYLQFRA